MSDPLDLEEALFSDAVARSGTERAEFLRELTTEQPALAARVVALLAAHERPTMLQAEPPSVAKIGRYSIGQKLGEGGVGIVFRATQQEPFRREVALKLIKPGMDTAEV